MFDNISIVVSPRSRPLQMSFETTTDFMAKAAVARSSDRLESPSARIVMGRVGNFGTGMFDLRQPAEFGGVGQVGGQE